MDQVANLPAKQRAELFQEAGSRRGTGSVVTEKDYDAMRVMIFGEVPQFGRIIETLEGLEEEINHR
jgi:hypothetical protein